MRSRPNTRTIPSVRVVLPEPLSPQTATINGFCIPVFCIPYRFVQSLRDSFAAIRTIAALGSLPGALHRLRALLFQGEGSRSSRSLELSRSIAEKSASGYRQKRRIERAVSQFCRFSNQATTDTILAVSSNLQYPQTDRYCISVRPLSPGGIVQRKT